MPDTLISFIRGTLAFFSLLVLTRLMGKQQVQQLNFFEYVTGITIGSIAASLTTDLHVNAAVHWVGLITWTLWTLVLGVITVHSRPMSKLIHGEPTVVIHNGKILERNLERMNYTLDDLRMQLRQKNAFNIADVVRSWSPTGSPSSSSRSCSRSPRPIWALPPLQGPPGRTGDRRRPVDATCGSSTEPPVVNRRDRPARPPARASVLRRARHGRESVRGPAGRLGGDTGRAGHHRLRGRRTPCASS